MLTPSQNIAITLQAYKYAGIEEVPKVATFLSKAGQELFWANRAKDVGAAVVVGTPLYGYQKLREHSMRKALQNPPVPKKASNLEDTNVTLGIQAGRIARGTYPYLKKLVRKPGFYAALGIPVAGGIALEETLRHRKPAKKASMVDNPNPCY